MKYCQDRYPKGQYYEVNLARMDNWWKEQGFMKFKKPLVICCNNTLLVLPVEIRSSVVSNMMMVAGVEGKVLITIWDGRFFSHAVIAYYAKNPSLCGPFTIEEHVDFDERHLETPSGYCTTWLLAEQVVQIMQSYDINDIYYRRGVSSNSVLSGNYVENVDIGIFVWLNGSAKNTAKDYYDSDDAQSFYSLVWGESTIHIGRYDELDKELAIDDNNDMPHSERILKAQQIHEAWYLKKIANLMQGSSPFRIADLGCGFGGFLRDITSTGMVWKGYGYDISGEMINRCKSLTEKCDTNNAKHTNSNNNDDTIPILNEKITWGVESYLCTSLANESVDLVFSMDAFLHVGEKMHATVLEEVWRVLRPGGYLIFNDIMQRPDANPVEMSPILARIHLSALGSVNNYTRCGEAQGFSNITFEDMSSNLPRHYGTIKQVLLELESNGTLSKANMTPTFIENMTKGLTMWENCGANNLHWGVITMQKTGSPNKK